VVICGLTFAVAATAATCTQSQPDFSGRWVMESPTSPPADAPLVLIVDQSAKRISIRRERASGVTNETHELGVVGGTVGGVASDGRSRGPSTRSETVWRLGVLMFLARTSGHDGPHTGDWSERSETWSLDPDGRLRVEIVLEGRDQPPHASLWLYRRE
jgi:hypothetical protein